MTQYRDAKIRSERDEVLSDEQAEKIEKPVCDETLRMWLALAKQQPDPVYADDSVRQELRDSFVNLRGANGYSEGEEVPVTFRKLPGVERVARAHAKLELSPVVTDRHAQQAMQMVGHSMQDYQTTEDGTLDADIAETGESKSQKDRKQTVANMVQEVQNESEGNGAVDRVVSKLEEDHAMDENTVRDDIDKLKRKGVLYSPNKDTLRFVGWG